MKNAFLSVFATIKSIISHKGKNSTLFSIFLHNYFAKNSSAFSVEKTELSAFDWIFYDPQTTVWGKAGFFGNS